MSDGMRWANGLDREETEKERIGEVLHLRAKLDTWRPVVEAAIVLEAADLARRAEGRAGFRSYAALDALEAAVRALPGEARR